jgi:hypothetical protein
LWPHPTPEGHDLNKLVFVLSQIAFKIPAFLAQWFIEKILKIFSYINTCKNDFPIVAPPDAPGIMV